MARRRQRRSKLAGKLIFPECILTEPQLQKCLLKWKRILRLQDWDIRLRLARHSQMHNANAAGEISPFDLKRQASISILHPQDFHLAFGDALFFPQDMEYTVVHELLHIYMHPLNGKEKDEEQAIHAIATALVQCHRGQW